MGVTPSATRRPKPQISRRTGRAPPGAFGGGIVQRQPTARCPLAHTAVSKRYTSPGVLRSKPNKHRARDAVETADLRFVSHFRSGSPPGHLGAARCWGPWVRRDPGVPRPLGICSSARKARKGEARRPKSKATGRRSVGLTGPHERSQDEKALFVTRRCCETIGRRLALKAV